jgi:hypothetical protein
MKFHCLSFFSLKLTAYQASGGAEIKIVAPPIFRIFHFPLGRLKSLFYFSWRIN